VKLLARICLWLYVLVFIASGAAIFVGAHDAARLVGVTAETLEQGGVSSLLNELRYLGAVAVGFGAAVAVLHKQILTEKRHAVLFVLVSFLLPLSRSISLFMDGVPHYALLLLMLAEYGLFAVFLLHTKRFVFAPQGSQAAEDADPEINQLARPASATSKRRTESGKSSMKAAP